MRQRLFWSAYGAVYDRLWDTPLTDAVAAEVVASSPPDLPVVEVGAGTGLMTRALVAAGRPMAAAYEPQPAMARRLRAAVPGVPVIAAGVRDLAPTALPRCVVAVNVLHLLDDPLGGLACLGRAAGAGGTVVVVTPAPGLRLLDVASAQRAAGARRSRVAGFLALHALLAPLTALAGRSVCELPSGWSARARDVRPIAGVSVLAVLDGSGPPVTNRTARTVLRARTVPTRPS